MATAALTPRVRTIVICDDVSASLTKLESSRWRAFVFEFVTSQLPIRAPLYIFLALSSARKGTFPGYVLLIN